MMDYVHRNKSKRDPRLGPSLVGPTGHVILPETGGATSLSTVTHDRIASISCHTSWDTTLRPPGDSVALQPPSWKVTVVDPATMWTRELVAVFRAVVHDTS